MNCKLCQELLDAYLEKRLPSGTKIQVEAHLGTCKECAESFRILILAERIMEREKQILSNPFLSTRIMESIAEPLKPVFRSAPIYTSLIRPTLVAISVSAAIIYGIIVGNLYHTGTREAFSPMELVLIDDASLEQLKMLSTD